MANPYQRASNRRKLIYFGTILGLLLVTIFVRGVVAMPVAGLKNSIGKWTIQEQSEKLELTEQSQGDVELTGSAIRLLLTGSRGLAICGLWISANEKQKQQEWNELELIVKSITKLQPHFLTPWLFQSWNLTYNVSVEMDSLNDMYFYISRGINLLAEGEAINHHSPDMRYALAFYYQNKFTVSDKVTTLRCLYQLSCIPKEERDYRSLMRGGEVDLALFKAFCEKNPQLVRRLRETQIRYGKDSSGNELVTYLALTPKRVVDFLRENEVVPNRFRDDDPRVLEDRLKQFPVLPPPFYQQANEEANPDRPIGDGESSALRASRVWFRYANEAIPEPNPDLKDMERQKNRRMPKAPTLIIFRQGPPRAQTYIAEFLARDGWFDRDAWVVDEGQDRSERWFNEDVRIKPTANAQEEWEIAHRMWVDHGRENGLNRQPFELENLRKVAEVYARKRGFTPGGQMLEPRPGDFEEYRESIKANIILMQYQRDLGLTNYETFLYQSEAEKAPETITARKLFFQADRARKRGESSTAIALYEQVLGTQQKLGLWGKILLSRKTFRSRGERILEETYENQINYLRLVRAARMPELRKATLMLFDILRNANPALQASPYYFAMSETIVQPKLPALEAVEAIWPPGPFDGDDPEGALWIPEHVKDRVRMNMNLTKPKAGAGPPPGMGPQGPPGAPSAAVSRASD